MRWRWPAAEAMTEHPAVLQLRLLQAVVEVAAVRPPRRALSRTVQVFGEKLGEDACLTDRRLSARGQ